MENGRMMMHATRYMEWDRRDGVFGFYAEDDNIKESLPFSRFSRFVHDDE
jgi:hypothetical protein